MVKLREVKGNKTLWTSVPEIVYHYFPHMRNMEEERMTSLKSAAAAFVPKKNISDLKEISVDVEILSRVAKAKNKQTGAEEEYVEEYITVGGVDYRIPQSVKEGIKMVLEKKPNLKTFAVAKSGSGLQTKYQVVPLD
jgi:hypothetical protein